MDMIIDKFKLSGKAAGSIAANAAAKRLIDKVVQYMTISSDQGMIASFGRQLMRELGREDKIWRQ